MLGWGGSCTQHGVQPLTEPLPDLLAPTAIIMLGFQEWTNAIFSACSWVKIFANFQIQPPPLPTLRPAPLRPQFCW